MNISETTEQTSSFTNRWIFSPPPEPARVRRLSSELRIPGPIAEVLLQRGITDFETAKRFFRPDLTHLHDPFLMDGMEAAVARIRTAVSRNERICVYGDYDVDGTNATSMLYLFLRSQGAQVQFYIPDRRADGYGLSESGIAKVHASGATLLISVDCGITAVGPVHQATRLGVDTIICDHHEPGSELPPAVAVLDPLKPGDSYPFKGLCGCGVALKLIQALSSELSNPDTAAEYIEFAALGTVADIVPLVDENRTIVKAGLAAINATGRTGLRALIREAGLHGSEISTGQVVFALAPRINAAGRLGDATRAVRLLITGDEQEAAELATILEQENLLRRKIDEQTFEEAVGLFEASQSTTDSSAIVLHSGAWHPGVIGIVASRMVDRFYKPSIMLTTVDGVAKGSARSVPGFDLHGALSRCSEMMIQFGGHKYAAGLSIEVPRISEFAEQFNAVVNELMTEDLRRPAVRIDTEISLSDLTPRFVRLLREFAPFGPGNAKPQFLARGLRLAGNPRIVGKNHLKFQVRKDDAVLDAIGFGLGNLLPDLRRMKDNLDLVFSVEENDYAVRTGMTDGGPIPQLKIRDIRAGTHAGGKTLTATALQ